MLEAVFNSIRDIWLVIVDVGDYVVVARDICMLLVKGSDDFKHFVMSVVKLSLLKGYLAAMRT